MSDFNTLKDLRERIEHEQAAEDKRRKEWHENTLTPLLRQLKALENDMARMIYGWSINDELIVTPEYWAWEEKRQSDLNSRPYLWFEIGDTVHIEWIDLKKACVGINFGNSVIGNIPVSMITHMRNAYLQSVNDEA